MMLFSINLHTLNCHIFKPIHDKEKITHAFHKLNQIQFEIKEGREQFIKQPSSMKENSVIKLIFTTSMTSLINEDK
jgi:ABC-type ATPase involved in cell division